MAEVTVKRPAPQLHLGSASQAPSIEELVERIVTLAGMTPTEVVAVMGTNAGQKLTHVEVLEFDGVDADRYLRPWASVAPATPGALNDAQYGQFCAANIPIRPSPRKSPANSMALVSGRRPDATFITRVKMTNKCPLLGAFDRTQLRS